MRADQKSTGNSPVFRATDGTMFYVPGDSSVDYVLHPVFLHFFAVAVLVFVALDQSNASSLPTGWHIAISWIIIAFVAIVWLAALTSLQLALWRKGWIRAFYTPIYLVPMVIIADFARTGYETFITGVPFDRLSPLDINVARDCFAVLLFDVLHARYVTRVHPLAVSADLQARTPAPLLTTPPPDVAAAAAPPDPAEAVPRVTAQIGTATFDLADLLTVRTRDHRVEVTTPDGTSLHRARLSDIAELQDPRFGLQVNRSVWVAFAAIADVDEPEPGQIDIRLRTGDVERVARPRLHAFRQAWRARTSADPPDPKRQNLAQDTAHAVAG